MEIGNSKKETKIAEPVVYTLGTSNRSIEEFVALLKKWKIVCAVDVRRFPHSHFSHFNKDALLHHLTAEGIEYAHLGDPLGGYRKRGYIRHTKGREFKRALEALKRMAREGALCIFCAERLPERCHRRFIADSLSREGWQVTHIISTNKTRCPSQQNLLFLRKTSEIRER
ncbi:MAG: DUF488 domain-containing protein [Planctomycetota bacterium]|nr:DUF488 domain-containing protein [Planctomycetota bacterium]